MSAHRSILVVLPHRRYFYDLPAHGTVTIGRAPGCQLRIEDAVVSRRHAILHLHPTLRVEDLGSENGTIVEISSGGAERTVTTELLRSDSLEIAAGTVIRLGDSRLVLQGAAPLAREDLLGGGSAKMQAVLETAALASRSRITVIVQGETGVGKEVLAERIHELSGRPAERFFRLSCAGQVESRLDHQLFGSETVRGLLEAADHGTLFLDEIGELPPSLQTRLLGVLEDGRIIRAGGREPAPVDVRIIAATNRRLEDDVASGRFRADLFFRLYGISIEVPPLRERVDEVVPLAQLFLARSARAERLPVPTFSAQTLALLAAYPWPGNTRELRHVVHRALLLCRTGVIEPGHLPESVRSGRSVIHGPDAPAEPLPAPAPALPASEPGAAGDRPAPASDTERDRILQALEATGGNQSKTARLLGISRMTLIRRIRKYGAHRMVTIR